ncbi:MAG: CHASE2 domain-containing protein [Alphaproteobacteria bacterium]|nr:CHASE2 domain-containing protein [Alphaproteobacteria bacterium]
MKRIDLDFPVEGASLGLGVAVAAWAASRGLPVPAGWSFTGRVGPLGQVLPVEPSSLPLKLRAVAATGGGRLMLPAAHREDADRVMRDGDASLKAVELVFVEDLRAARRLLFQPRRQLLRLALPLLVPPLLALFGVTQVPDLALSQLAFFAARGPLAADDVVVLGLSRAPDTAEVRGRHGDLVREMHRRGADVVAFDLVFRSCAPEELDGLVAAAEALQEELPVVVGVQWLVPHTASWEAATAQGRSVDGYCAPALQDVTRGGLVNARLQAFSFNVDDWGLGFGLGRFPVRRADAFGEHYALACEVLAARAGDGLRARQGQDLRCGDVVNAAPGGFVSLVPSDRPPTWDYLTPASWGSLQNKIVLVGGLLDRDAYPTPLGRRYGVELQAALIETLAAEQAPVWLPPPVVALLAALLEGLGLALLWWTRPRGRTSALALCGVAAVVAVVWGAQAGAVVPVTPLLLALLVLWRQAPRVDRLR